MRPIVVPMTIETTETTVSMAVSAITQQISFDIGHMIMPDPYPAYDGPMEVTPTRETQTLATAMRSLTGNVIINPIPQNYGLITWNGSTLTVS